MLAFYLVYDRAVVPLERRDDERVAAVDVDVVGEGGVDAFHLPLRVRDALGRDRAQLRKRVLSVMLGAQATDGLRGVSHTSQETKQRRTD